MAHWYDLPAPASGNASRVTWCVRGAVCIARSSPSGVPALRVCAPSWLPLSVEQGNLNAYAATNCTVFLASASSSTIRCITAPGVGPDLFWGLVIGTQSAPSRVGPTAYGRPVVAFYTGAGSANAVTTGNQLVQIYGSNFGPIGTPVTAKYTTNRAVSSLATPAAAVAAAYVPDGFNYGANGELAEFPAVGCVVAEAHRLVNCTTTAGAGNDITWVLTIGNQTSQSPVTSYGCVAVFAPLPSDMRSSGLFPRCDPLCLSWLCAVCALVAGHLLLRLLQWLRFGATEV
jgi:hypothetical protein